MLQEELSVLDTPPPWVVHLMAHLDWQSRANLFTLNSSWRGLMGAKPLLLVAVGDLLPKARLSSFEWSLYVLEFETGGVRFSSS